MDCPCLNLEASLMMSYGLFRGQERNQHNSQGNSRIEPIKVKKRTHNQNISKHIKPIGNGREAHLSEPQKSLYKYIYIYIITARAQLKLSTLQQLNNHELSARLFAFLLLEFGRHEAILPTEAASCQRTSWEDTVLRTREYISLKRCCHAAEMLTRSVATHLGPALEGAKPVV